MKNLFIFLILFVAQAINCGTYLNAHSDTSPISWQEQKLIDLYSWFNSIADPQNAFSKEGLHQYFTDDFVMQANDIEVTRNYEDLYNHFEAFRKSGATLKVNLPLDEVVLDQKGDKIAVRYSIEEKEDSGKQRKILVIAIWHFAPDGRLRRMNEVFTLAD